MDVFAQFISSVNSFVWGPWMLVFLVGTGIFLTVRLVFLQFQSLGYGLKLAFTRSQDQDSGRYLPLPSLDDRSCSNYWNR